MASNTQKRYITTIILLLAILTCSKVTQLSASHIGISGGPEVITDSSPYTVQTHLHTTSVWCCPTNQPDVTSTASCRREKTILYWNIVQTRLLLNSRSSNLTPDNMPYMTCFTKTYFTEIGIVS